MGGIIDSVDMSLRKLQELAGPESRPVFGCHVLNSKGKIPGGGSEPGSTQLT